MQSKKEIIERNLVVFENQDENKIVTVQDCFEYLINNFNQQHEDPFGMISAISLGGVLVETVIKERLFEINPALILKNPEPQNLALIAGFEEKLISSPTIKPCNVKTENIKKLIERYKEFFELPSEKIICDFLDIRNSLMHSGFKFSVDELLLAQILTGHVFPFLRKHLEIKPEIWQIFQQIQQVYHDEFKVDLLRKIVKARENFLSIGPAQVQRAIEKDLNLSKDEFVIYSNLVCPSCGKSHTSYTGAVDIDGGPEGASINTYTYSYCPVCELRLAQVEIQEIVDHPKLYFHDPDVVSEWVDALDTLNFSEIYP